MHDIPMVELGGAFQILVVKKFQISDFPARLWGRHSHAPHIQTKFLIQGTKTSEQSITLWQ